MSAIEIRDMTLRYGEREIISRLSLTVRQGEILSIIGPSGCGKTTLLRLMAGLVKPSEGTVSSDGRQVENPSRHRAIVFQDYGRALLPWRRVWANVALPLELEGVKAAERRAKALELLEVMQLGHVADHFPDQLSGGMQQRVQIARTLAQNPQIWFMDEPFGALDALTRQQLQDEVLRVAAERGITVVFITHDLEEAIYLGDRVIVLGAHPGRIVEEITVDLPRPRNQLTTREDTRFLHHRHKLFGLLEVH